jgi:hypothetical protein
VGSKSSVSQIEFGDATTQRFEATHLPVYKSKDPSRTRVSLVDAYIDGNGRRVVHGNCELKASQAYPPPFGRAVFRVWERHRVDLLAEAAERMVKFKESLSDGLQPVDLFGILPEADMWEDANLSPVFNYLQTGNVPS